MPIADFDCARCGVVSDLDVRSAFCPICGGGVTRRWQGKAPGELKVAPFVDSLLNLPSTPEPLTKSFAKAPEMEIGEMKIAKKGERPISSVLNPSNALKMITPDARQASRTIAPSVFGKLGLPIPKRGE